MTDETIVVLQWVGGGLGFVILMWLSSWFYRIGGASRNEFPMLPEWLVHGTTRDVGCMICFTLTAMLYYGVHHTWWQWLGFLVCSFIGLRSYGAKFNKAAAKYFMDNVNDAYREGEIQEWAKDDALRSLQHLHDNKFWWNWAYVAMFIFARHLWFSQCLGLAVFHIGVAVVSVLVRCHCDEVNGEELVSGTLYNL